MQSTTPPPVAPSAVPVKAPPQPRPAAATLPAAPGQSPDGPAVQATPPGGRPRSFSKNQEHVYCDLLRSGLSTIDAARILHVSPKTIRRRQREDPAFLESVAQALYSSDTENFRAIAKAGQKSWRAAAWLVQHRSREARPHSNPRDNSLALLKSEAFQELLRDLVCEAVIANEVTADSLTVSRRRRLVELEAEIASRRRKGEDHTNLERIADELRRDMVKTLRMKMRRR
jgi:hypothetical protein